MASVKKHERQRVLVSASELAQMGVCERLVVFEHRFGKRRTVAQRRAVERGRRAHDRFFRERCTKPIRRRATGILILKCEAQGFRKMLVWQGRYWIQWLRKVWCQLVCSDPPRPLWGEHFNEH